MERIILHCDLDAFYAAVEQRDHPELTGKPVIVGGNPGSRGVVSTCSYEARKYGVRSAMPLAEARRRCPEAIFVPGSMSRYREVSRAVFAVFHRFAPVVEQVSIDEAFLDLTGCGRLWGSPTELAQKLKEAVTAEVALTVSVGVAPNKLLAKIASELEKPDGLVIVDPERVEEFLAPLPVNRIWGVGPQTAAILKKAGIKTVGALAEARPEVVEKLVGLQMAQHLQLLARGADFSPVVAGGPAKSVSHECTFSRDVDSVEALHTTLLQLAQRVGRRLRKGKMVGKTVTIKLRYADFETVSRSATLCNPTCDDLELYQEGCRLMEALVISGRKVRLLGLGVSRLTGSGDNLQLSLVKDQSGLYRAIDAMRDRYGEGVITRGSLLPAAKPLSAENGDKNHTPEEEE